MRKALRELHCFCTVVHYISALELFLETNGLTTETVRSFCIVLSLLSCSVKDVFTVRESQRCSGDSNKLPTSLLQFPIKKD